MAASIILEYGYVPRKLLFPVNIRAAFRFLGSLDAVGRSLLVEAAVLPKLVFLSFRAFGVPATQKYLRLWAERFTVQATSSEDDVISLALRIQRTLARRTGIGGSCLTTSMVLWTMLQRRKIDSEIRIGMKRDTPGIEIHAWLQRRGIPINESLERAASFEVYPDPFIFDEHN